MKPTVYIPEKIGVAGLAMLQAECNCVLPWEGSPDAPPPPPRELLYECDAVMVRLFTVRADDLAKAPRLRVISKHGVGVDNIDIEAAAARKIPVVYAPNASSNAVAEHAITLMLALARQSEAAHSLVKAGGFSKRDRFQGIEMEGRTLGIVGIGRIGSRVANKGAGLGMKVLAYDPPLDKSKYQGPATFVDSLEELFQRSDIVTLHAPLTPETRNMIDAKSLKWLRPTARLINTSRGAVVDEQALARALQAGELAGAAIDVFEQEPVPADHPLCNAPNALLTPHISASTQESWDRVSRMAAQGILDVLQGRQPEHVWPV